MKKPICTFLFLFCIIAFARAAMASSEITTFPTEAKLTGDKVFVRSEPSTQSQRLTNLAINSVVTVLAREMGDMQYPWYKVRYSDGEGWVYGQYVEAINDDTTAPFERASADGRYVTVVAIGQGTDRAKALEQAWIEAVRLAVGTIISSKSELNNDEFAESTIAHSRGVIESFDVVDEKNDGKRTTVTIRAKVQKEILVDATKVYMGEQIVKANAGETVKIQMDMAAKEATLENKQQSGKELLKEVLEAYSKPELFYSAELDSKVYFDKESKQPYLKISEKFNEERFWKEFLPKLRKALDGVAEKQEKRFYSDAERQMNQLLTKSRKVEGQAFFLHFFGFTPDWAYSWLGPLKAGSSNYGEYLPSYITKINPEKKLLVIVPTNLSAYVVYTLPCKINTGGGLFRLNYEGERLNAYGFPLIWEEGISDPEFYALFVKYARDMGRAVIFSIAFLDKDGEEISSQATNRKNLQSLDDGDSPYPVIYRSMGRDNNGYVAFLGNPIAFAPGLVRTSEVNIKTLQQGYRIEDGKNVAAGIFLDTKGTELKVPLDLEADELEQVKNMKFEVVFEK